MEHCDRCSEQPADVTRLMLLERGSCIHLGGDIIAQSSDPVFGAVAQTANLSSDKVQPVSEILAFLQAGDPIRGQRSVRQNG